jgi:hypothetical protein
VDQGQKLLVEDNKVALLDFAAPSQGDLAARQKAPRLDGIHQEALLRITLTDLRRGVAVFDLLQRPAPVIGHSYQKFGHASCV